MMRAALTRSESGATNMKSSEGEENGANDYDAMLVPFAYKLECNRDRTPCPKTKKRDAGLHDAR